MNNSNYIIFASIILLQIFLAIKGIFTSRTPIESRVRFYTRGLMLDILIISIYFFLNSELFKPLDFRRIPPGIKIDGVISTGLVAFLIVQILSQIFTTPNVKRGELNVGIPTNFLPVTKRQFGIFILYLVSGAFFEELICRQFMFFYLSQIFSFNEDLIIVISAGLFSLVHLYQGWKGVIGAFVIGIILGKLFAWSQNLIYPIILHLLLNLGTAFAAYKSMRTVSKGSTENSAF